MQKHIFNKTPRLLYCLLPIAFYCNSLFANTINLNQKQGWDIGVQALYLKSSYSDGFAYLDDTRVSLNTDRRNPLKLDWGWGFKVEGSYHYCPNSDININWSHYKKSADGDFVFRTNPTADHYTVTPQWDAVNLEFGQYINFDQIKNLRLYGGVQYARIKTTYHGEGVDPITGPGSEDDIMKYSGIGPRIGANLSVGIQNGLSAYVDGDASLLVGRSNFSFDETFGPGYSTSGTRSTVIVPEVGIKLGGKYDYSMSCGDLVFDAGYMVVNYFNPLHLRDDFTASETNFALNGWYAGVKWIMW